MACSPGRTNCFLKIRLLDKNTLKPVTTDALYETRDATYTQTGATSGCDACVVSVVHKHVQGTADVVDSTFGNNASSRRNPQGPSARRCTDPRVP